MPRITITVPEKNAQPYRFGLDSHVVKFGRNAENDVVIDSGSVSSFHAEMRRIHGGYELQDLGSTNGLKLGEDSYSRIPLQSGMRAKIGDVAFDFLLSDDELRTLAQEAAPLPAHVPVVAALTPASAVAPEALPLPVAEKPVRKPVEYSQRYAPRSSGAGSKFFLIFAIIAFCVGLAIRFNKETGGSLHTAVQAKFLPPQGAPPQATLPR
jgi:pSer/pThr/pTyr-binding forkhead associated (FHA) protein